MSRDQCVAGVFALADYRNMQPLGLNDGDIFHRVDSHINPPLQECLLKFLQEKAFAPFGSKRDIKGAVTFCGNPHQLNFKICMRAQ